MSRTYFQFPLCALSFGLTERERFDHIVSFCCLKRGTRRWEMLSPDERARYRSARDSPFRSIPGIRLNVVADLQAQLGAEQLNVRLGGFTSTWNSFAFLSEYISSFERNHGRDAQVRIRTDWLFETWHGRGLSYPEFAVLVGHLQ